MKKIIIVFFISICLGMISSFTIEESSITTDCYVIADKENAEIIYIPDNSEFDGRVFMDMK